MGSIEFPQLLDDRRRLLADPAWIRNHTNGIAARFRLSAEEIDDLVQQGAMFLLSQYHAQNFDPSYYPQFDGESKEAYNARLIHQLKAHAGISLVRYLALYRQKLVRYTSKMTDLPDEMRHEPQDHQAIGVRQKIEKMAVRCGLSGDPRAMRIGRIIGRVVNGEDFSKVLRTECPRRRERNELMSWARTVLNGVTE